ncbi:ankyrin repeat domain-containing protein [Wolbachia endosymbiont (group A) of Paraperithous gnathaulax]|uniref:ankyrin repeat domain-containing protein n=1 Tax=Wolbachia endosymbiont (group A) of Paraperithous gnathaulax TaxID=3066212 RepID=UPI00333E4320
MNFGQLLESLISAINKEHIMNRIKEELEQQGKDSEDVYEEWLDSKLDTEYASAMLDSQEDIGVEETFLYAVVCLGKLETVKYLVDEKKANVDAKSSSSCTALHFAAERGYLDIVKYLVDKEANVDAQDNNGCTPLHIAAQNGHSDLVKYFINQTKVDVNIKSGCGCTLLHFAAEGGNLEAVEYLVGKGANANVRDNWGYTPLHSATERGYLDIVRYFVENLTGEKEVYIDAQNDDESTPLHLAVECGYSDIAKYLVENGADVDAVDVNKKTPSDIVDEYSHPGVVEFLNKKRVTSDANSNVPSQAAKRTKLDKVQEDNIELLITSISKLSRTEGITDKM